MSRPKKYTKVDLERAVSAVKDGGISIREAEKAYGVPFNTIRRRVNGEVDMDCERPGPKPMLGVNCEKEIYDAVVELQQMGHGLSRKEIIQLAGDVDAKNETKVFKNSLPSKRWYKSFMARHNLTLRQPENLSSARSSMATSDVKEEFFNKLMNLIKELNISGADLYNVDETGLTLVNKGGKIVAPKGSKTVVMKKSGERSENITLVVSCNATASVILPPMVIFKGVRMNEDLMKEAPEDTIFATSLKGYIDSEIFYMWFVKFLNRIPAKRPVLLLLDGHASHLSKETLLLARENQVHFLMFPPHTTHLYQPLDVGVFGPMKKAFSEECTKLMRKNKKKYLNRYDFCKVLKPAWEKSVTTANILGGFRGSGVWPTNPEAVQSHRLIGCSGENIYGPTSSVTSYEAGSSSSNDPQPAPSPVIQAIRQLLQPEVEATKRSRRVTTTRCVTSEEFLKEMEEKEKSKSKKRKVQDDDSVGSDSDASREIDENMCSECGGLFEDDCHGENWIKCYRCKSWYHQTCQNLANSARPKMFVCLKCRSK